jgi:epoxyqueuosine reductase
VNATLSTESLNALAQSIKRWGEELGFQAIGISGTDLSQEEAWLAAWLHAGCHGGMDYMARHGTARSRPAELVPGTLRVISARLNYTPTSATASEAVLEDPEAAFVSRYALGRDYHKVLRHKLQSLADRVTHSLGSAANEFGYRVFTDSAPVMEVALAKHAGLGWRGKHTLLLSREVGSLFFLGEIYTTLPLPVDAPVTEHCGSCTRCIDVCPTQAIVAPYKLDARRCISYLTIELKDAIPVEFRRAIGNRIYGCDDCQLVCPWNKYATLSREADFTVRNGLDDATLLELFAWSEADFNLRLAGSAIRRIGFERWQRNIAIALGNALAHQRTGGEARARIGRVLEQAKTGSTPMVREHIDWALAQAQ